MIIFFTISNLGFSQVVDEDKWTNKFEKDRCDFLDVSQIQNLNEELIFRFWNQNYLLEVIRSKEQVKGRVIFAVRDKDHGHFFRKIFILSTEDSKYLYNVFNEKYDELKVLDHKKGSDGESYSYQKKYWNKYSGMSYSTCCNDVNDAQNYITLNSELESIVKSRSYLEIFEKEIPFRRYSYYDGSLIYINRQLQN